MAVIRQEGSNGDREMLSSFHAAGLEVRACDNYDVIDIDDDDDYRGGGDDCDYYDDKNSNKEDIKS